MTKCFWAECIGSGGRTHDDCDQIHDGCGQTIYRQDLPILMITAELNANRLD